MQQNEDNIKSLQLIGIAVEPKLHISNNNLSVMHQHVMVWVVLNMLRFIIDRQFLYIMDWKFLKIFGWKYNINWIITRYIRYKWEKEINFKVFTE